MDQLRLSTRSSIPDSKRGRLFYRDCCGPDWLYLSRETADAQLSCSRSGMLLGVCISKVFGKQYCDISICDVAFGCKTLQVEGRYCFADGSAAFQELGGVKLKAAQEAGKGNWDGTDRVQNPATSQFHTPPMRAVRNALGVAPLTLVTLERRNMRMTSHSRTP